MRSALRFCAHESAAPFDFEAGQRLFILFSGF